MLKLMQALDRHVNALLLEIRGRSFLSVISRVDQFTRKVTLQPHPYHHQYPAPGAFPTGVWLAGWPLQNWLNSLNQLLFAIDK